MYTCLIASTLLLTEAKDLYREQDLEKGIKTFLEAIPEKNLKNTPKPEELALYETALHEYLEHGASTAKLSSEKILEQYLPIIEIHPDYHLIRFFVAAAYANLGQFEQFFDQFYTVYQYYPDHYLSYKTKAILHIKLLERARTDSERINQKKEILKNLAQAKERYPRDHNLYKLMIYFSDSNQQKNIVSISLKKIIEENIIVPRSDISFYAKIAIDTDQEDLAKRFVEKAKEWYKYSRALENYKISETEH